MQTIADLLILCVLEVLSCQRLLTSNLVIRILATKGERIGTVGLVYKLFHLLIRTLQEYIIGRTKKQGKGDYKEQMTIEKKKTKNQTKTKVEIKDMLQ